MLGDMILTAQDDTTVLNIGGGYVGSTDPGPGYGVVSAVNAPDVPVANQFAAWLQANKSAVYLGSGALLLMAMFGGRRR